MQETTENIQENLAGGELLQSAVKAVANVEVSKDTEVKSTVSQFALMVPWLLKSQDFGALIYQLEDIRHPEEVEKPLLEAVEEVKEAA